MKKNINVRMLAIAILAVIATVMGITIVYYNLFQKQVRTDLSVTANLLKDTHYFDDTTQKVEEFDLSTDVEDLRVTWIDAEGTVLYDNDASAETLANHHDRPEIQEAYDFGVGESVRNSDTMNRNTYYYALLLDNGTVLRVATNAENLFSVFLSAFPILVLIILCIIAVCAIISHVLTKQLIRPIEQMAQHLEDSDYETPYKELEPFSVMVRAQHADVLAAAKVRQDFTANVSHELKTPLTAVSGYAELLEGDMVEDSKKKHMYREIRNNSDRLLTLINDIIRLSEIDRGDYTDAFEDMNLHAIAQECMEALDVNAKQQDIALTYEGESCHIVAGKDMIKELIENLVQNAIRYNNPGGSVSVRVRKEERPTLVVADNGIGIPLAEQKRIFERFYRVDKSRSKATGGTGLGLSIVKNIVEIHDAKLDLVSEPGVGTTITITF